MAWHQQPSAANMRAMPFEFPQPHGCREREMSVRAFCGLLLTKGSLPPSLLPCCLCCSSVISTLDSAGSSGHLPTESELNHCPTLSTGAPGLLGMQLWWCFGGSSVCLSVGMDGECCHLAPGGGLLLCGIEVQEKLRGR